MVMFRHRHSAALSNASGSAPCQAPLQPATNRRFVSQILLSEFLRQAPLLPCDNTIRDYDKRGDQHSQKPRAVDPDRDTDVEESERYIDGVSTEPIWSGPEDG